MRRLDTGVIQDRGVDYDAEFAVTTADQMVERGYVDRAHNAYRMADEITVLEPLGWRRHRIDMTV